MFILEGLIEGTFFSRLNRFVCECEIDGKKVLAHLPNSGRLLGLLSHGRKVYARRTVREGNLPYRLIFVEWKDFKVLVDTSLTNDLVSTLIEKGMIPQFVGYTVKKKEVYFGGRRFDLLLENEGKGMVLEVKNCTLFFDSLSMFPDCETARGRAHLDGLIRIREDGLNSGVIFIVSSPRVKYFLPDFHNDFSFSKRLIQAKDTIQVLAYSVRFGDDFSIEGVDELLIPWEELEKVEENSGLYMIVMDVDKETTLSLQGLGKINLKKGYYIYVGSASKNLKERIERHRRRRKKTFWHVDHLTSLFPPSFYFPIRIERSYECEIAKKLLEISDWVVPGFGSSDCRCVAHLAGFKENPLNQERFVDLLFYFRIGTIAERLKKIEI